jgi:hypothetical protein
MLLLHVASCMLQERAVWTRLDVPQVEQVRRVDQHHDTPCVAFVLSVSRNVTTTKKQQAALQQTRRNKQHCNKHVATANRHPQQMHICNHEMRCREMHWLAVARATSPTAARIKTRHA